MTPTVVSSVYSGRLRYVRTKSFSRFTSSISTARGHGVRAVSLLRCKPRPSCTRRCVTKCEYAALGVAVRHYLDVGAVDHVHFGLQLVVGKRYLLAADSRDLPMDCPFCQLPPRRLASLYFSNIRYSRIPYSRVSCFIAFRDFLSLISSNQATLATPAMKQTTRSYGANGAK